MRWLPASTRGGRPFWEIRAASSERTAGKIERIQSLGHSEVKSDAVTRHTRPGPDLDRSLEGLGRPQVAQAAESGSRLPTPGG